jgi:hypothetical protein
MPSEVASRDGGAGVSMTAHPKSRAASSKAPRVTPGKAPVVSGGVWREPGSHQKTFPLELSVTMPLVFTSKASSNPSPSASARAKTFKSLLADLWADNGSPAATLNDEHVLRVSAGQPSRGIGGDGWAVMMNLGTSAPRGEYPRGPTPRLRCIRTVACGVVSEAVMARMPARTWVSFQWIRIPMNFAPRASRSQCCRHRKSRPESQGRLSKSPSPYRNERSNTGTKASATGRTWPSIQTESLNGAAFLLGPPRRWPAMPAAPARVRWPWPGFRRTRPRVPNRPRCRPRRGTKPGR